MTAPYPSLQGEKITSPCLSICEMEENAGLCLGCGRTRAEIATWVRMGETARKEIMAALPQRMAKLDVRSGKV